MSFLLKTSINRFNSWPLDGTNVIDNKFNPKSPVTTFIATQSSATQLWFGRYVVNTTKRFEELRPHLAQVNRQSLPSDWPMVSQPRHLCRNSQPISEATAISSFIQRLQEPLQKSSLNDFQIGQKSFCECRFCSTLNIQRFFFIFIFLNVLSKYQSNKVENAAQCITWFRRLV